MSLDEVSPWWAENDMRLVQTNLREPDARMDFDALLDRLQDFSANVWLMNTGGISAFYPTDLDYQHQNPYLDHDLLQEALEKCHANDIRIISRFDFSKVHEDIYEENPEWAYRTADGEIINYHGMVHTCVSSGYQREYSLEILEEVLSRYDVDGIFFNMFGYHEYDYSGNYHGPCHCENCQRQLREIFDAELPPKGYDDTHPSYDEYQKFKIRTVTALLDDIRDLVDSYDRDIAISTYTPYNVDIVTKESNTSLDQDPPKWLYSASENVASLEDSWDDKVISNIAINAVDIPYRFMGVSDDELRIRLYENMANGSGLSFCINGIFEDYPDHSNFDTVRNIYEFHESHEELFGDLTSMADAALVKPEDANEGQRREYRGIFKALKEEHILFDVIHQATLPDNLSALSNHELVIIPDIREADPEIVDGLAEQQSGGTSVLATNRSFVDESESAGISKLFSGRYQRRTEENRGAYLETRDKDIFERFPEQDWIFLDGNFSFVEFEEDVATFLPYITPAVYGPPERVGYDGNERSSNFGVGIKSTAGSQNAYLPWQVGSLYYEHGYEAHKRVLLDVFDYLLGEYEPPLTTNAPPSVEVFFDRVAPGRYLLQLLNLSGFNGTTYFDPVPKRDIRVSIPVLNGSTDVTKLTEGGPVEQRDGMGAEINVSELESYEAIEIKE
jgi:hypothetical protein